MEARKKASSPRGKSKIRKATGRVAKFSISPVKQRIKTSIAAVRRIPPKTKFVVAGFTVGVVIVIAALLALYGAPAHKTEAITANSILINNGAAYTNSTDVNLILSASSDAAEMMLSNDGFPSEAAQIANTLLLSKFNNSKDANYAAGDGTGNIGSSTDRYQLGMFGSTTGAKYFEEGTTNLVLNPSFEQPGAGSMPNHWTRASATANKWTWDNANAVPTIGGSYSFKATESGATGTNVVAYEILNVSPSTTYTYSGYIKTSNATAGARLKATPGSGTSFPSSGDTFSNNLTGTNNWTRVTGTVTTGASDDKIKLVLQFRGQVATGSAYFDAIQLEAKPSATSYADGDQGTGYTWNNGSAPATPGNFSVTLNNGSSYPLAGGNDYCYRVLEYDSSGSSAAVATSCVTPDGIDDDATITWTGSGGTYKILRATGATPYTPVDTDYKVIDNATSPFTDNNQVTWSDYMIPPASAAGTPSRTADTLYYNDASNISNSAGTIEFWTRPDLDASSMKDATFFDILNAGDTQIKIYFEDSSNKIKAVIMGDTGGTTVNLGSSALVFGAGEWLHIALTYNITADEYKLYLNGDKVDENTSTDITTLNFGGNGIYVGSNSSGAQQIRGRIDDLRILSVARSAANIASDAPARWIPYATSVATWSLIPVGQTSITDGTKTVYFEVRDSSGVLSGSPVSDTIILDTTPPSGSFVINGKIHNEAGAEITDNSYTHNLKNDLDLSGISDGLSGMYQMRFSNDNSNWDNWKAYNATESGWDLSDFGGSSADGAKTVYAEFSDNAGNIYSTSAPITLATAIDHLAFITSSFSTQAGSVSPQIKIQTQDAYNNPLNVSSDTTLYLWEDSTGNTEFSASLAPWVPVTQLTLVAASNENTKSFYYKDTKAGTPTISVTDQTPQTPDTSWTDASQVETITPAPPAQLNIVLPGGPYYVGAPAVVPTVEVQDQFGNIVTYDNTTNVLATVTGNAVIASANPSTVASGITTFMINDIVAEQITFSVSSGSLLPDSTNITIDPGVRTSYIIELPGETFVENSGISGSPSNWIANNAPTYTINLYAVDAYLNIVDSGANKVNENVTMGTSGNVQFNINPVSVTNGQGSTSAYNLKKESGINISATGTVSGISSNFTVNPAPVAYLVMELPGETFVDGVGITGGPATSQNVNSLINPTIYATDQFFNICDSGPNLYTGLKTLVYAGASVAPDGINNPKVFDNVGGLINFGNNTNINFINGIATALGLNGGILLYNADESPINITVTDSGNYGYQSSLLPVNPAALDHITFTANPSSTTAGIEVGPFTIERRDVYENKVISGNTVINLSTNSTGLSAEFRATPSGGSTSSVTISAPNSSVDFYYYDELASYVPPATTTYTLTANAGAGPLTKTTSLSVDPGVAVYLVNQLPGQSFAAETGISGSPNNQTAGSPFNILNLYATDSFYNITTNGFANGNHVITYSGPSNAPDGTPPSYTTSVDFTNGVATATLITTLYNAEIVALTTKEGAVSFTNPFALTINPGTADHFAISGSNTQTAGSPQTVTISALDSYDNVATSYVGDRALIYSGASIAVDSESSISFNPTIKDKTGAPVEFGTPTITAFTTGIASGDMVLYKAENASIAATDGIISTNPSAELGVTVSEDILDHIHVSPLAAGIPVNELWPTGSTQEFDALGHDAYGNIRTEVTDDSVTWTLSASAQVPAPSGSTNTITTGGAAGTNGFVTSFNTSDPLNYGYTPSYPNGVEATYGGITGYANFSIVPGNLTSFWVGIVGGSPKIAGNSFNIVVQPKDFQGNVLLSGPGITNISDTTGTISPTTYDIQGLTVIPVSITKAQTNVTITLKLGGADGTSSSFDVVPNVLDHFTLDIGSQTNRVAFIGTATITAKDAWDNTITNFDASSDNVTITSSIGAVYLDNSTPAVLDQAGDFASGVADVSGRLEYRGPANGSTIIFTATASSGPSGNAPVNMNPGPLYSLQIRTGANNTGVVYDYADGMTADDSRTLWAAGYDEDGNYRQDEDVDWALTGTLASATTPPTGENTYTFEPTTSEVSGTITIDSATIAGSPDFTSGTLSISDGALNYILIRDANSGGGAEVGTYAMTADDFIVLYAAGYDSDNNFIADQSVTWALTGTLSDPTFNTGPSTSVTFNPTTAPTSGTITADDGSGHADATGIIDVSVGALTTVRVEDLGGAEITTLVITTDDTLNLYCRGYDSDGNLRGDQTADWSADYPTGNVVSDTGVSQITFNPNYAELPVGTTIGRITATATDAPNPADATGDITVNPGALASFEITIGAPEPVPAGNDLQVVFTAKDADGNTTTTVSGDSDVTVDAGEIIYDGSPTSVVTIAETEFSDDGVYDVAANLHTLGLSLMGLDPTPRILTITNDPLTPGPGGNRNIEIDHNVEDTLAYIDGDGQTEEVLTATTVPLTVRVVDVYGNPVNDISVTFAITSVPPTSPLGQILTEAGNPTNTGDPIDVLTDLNGQAAAILTLGDKSGTYQVEASAVVPSGSPITFTETAAAAAADRYVVNVATPVVAGNPTNINVTAQDAYGNIATSYTGDVNLYYSGPSGSPDYPTNPINFFSGIASTTAIFYVAEDTALTVTDDPVTPVLFGTSSTFTVNPNDLDYFTIAGCPTEVTEGESFGASNITVSTYDSWGNLKTNYNGSVYFTSTDPAAVLPYTVGSEYTYNGGDNGTHVFSGSGFILNTVGNQTLNVTDGTIFASCNIQVKSAAPPPPPTYTITTFPVPPAPTYSLSPAAGLVGTEITITGTNGADFGATPGSVRFTSNISTPATSWSSTEIKVLVPQGAVTGLVQVIKSDQTVIDIGIFTVTTTIPAQLPSLSKSKVEANPTIIPADGRTTTTITVTLVDENNNPVAGKAVALMSNVSQDAITQPSSLTNSNGQTSGLVSSTPPPHISTITAKDTTDNLTLDAQAIIRFTLEAPQIDPSIEGKVFETSTPTFYGTAFPNALVTLYIQSNLVIATTRADASGNWTYTLTTPLEAGLHSIYAVAQDEFGNYSMISPLTFFTIKAGITPYVPTAPAAPKPITPTPAAPAVKPPTVVQPKIPVIPPKLIPAPTPIAPTPAPEAKPTPEKPPTPTPTVPPTVPERKAALPILPVTIGVTAFILIIAALIVWRKVKKANLEGTKEAPAILAVTSTEEETTEEAGETQEPIVFPEESGGTQTAPEQTTESPEAQPEETEESPPNHHRKSGKKHRE